MEATFDEKHLETLKLLGEVLAYLRALPHVPVTAQMCSKIQNHLDAPAARLQELSRTERRGAVYTAAGLPLLDASVIDDLLTVRFHNCPDGLSFPLGLVKAGSFDGESIVVNMPDGKDVRQPKYPTEFAKNIHAVRVNSRTGSLSCPVEPASAPVNDNLPKANDDGVFYE